MNLILNKSPPFDSTYTFFIDDKDREQWWSHYVYRSPSSHVIPHNPESVDLSPAPLVFLCRRKLIEMDRWWWYETSPLNDIEHRFQERYSALQFGPHIDGSHVWEIWPWMQVEIELPNLAKLYFRNSVAVDGWYKGKKGKEIEVVSTRPQFPLRFYSSYLCQNCSRESVVPLSVSAASGKYFSQCKNRLIVPEILRNPLQAACEYFFKQILRDREGIWTCDICKPTESLLFSLNAENSHPPQIIQPATH